MFQKSCFTILTGDRRISLPSTVLRVKKVPLHAPAMQSSIAGWIWKNQSWKRNEIGIFHCDLLVWQRVGSRYPPWSYQLAPETPAGWKMSFSSKNWGGNPCGFYLCFWAYKIIWKTIGFLGFDGKNPGSFGEMNQFFGSRCKHVQLIRWPIKSFKTPPKLDCDTVVKS